MSWRRANTVSVIAVVVLVAATLVPASPARAQSSGPYVTAGGGFTNRQRSSDNTVSYTDFNNDFAVNVAGGYKYQDEQRPVRNLAIEGEFSYFRNNANTVASLRTGPQPGVGNVALRVGMASVRYEIPIPSSFFAAYVSGGVGGFKSYLHGISNVVILQSSGLAANGSSDGVTFAYQLRAGAQFRVAPHADLIAGYRYLRGNPATFLGTAFGDLHPRGPRIHSVEAALRIQF